MRAKTDEELYLLLRVHSQDYSLQALSVASEEFQRRRLDAETISRIVASAEKALEKTDGVQGEPGRKTMSDAKETGTGCGCIFFLVIIGAAIFAGYEVLDSMGWVSHREETTISVRGDWLVGESKECKSYTRKKDWFTFQDKDVGYAITGFICDDGPEHQMKVTFYGRKVQPEYESISWRCEREQPWFGDGNSFTCYQTGGER